MPLISIITVVYNNKAGMSQTLASIHNQTSKSFEYIVIDGGSIDGTMDLLQANMSVIDILVSEKDNGIYEAMNKGWRLSKGDYCFFLNSGDYLYKDDVIEQVEAQIQYKPVDILYGSLWAFDEKQNWVSEYPEQISLHYLLTFFLPHPASFFKRSLLLQLNGYFEHYKIISDWVFYIRAFLTGAVFRKIPITVTAFYMEGRSSEIASSAFEKNNVFQKELAFLKTDFDNAVRLWHYDSSRLVQAASKLSKIKSRLSGR